MLETGKVKCPICGGELEEHDCIDIEVDTNWVSLFMVGKCLNCGNHYKWYKQFSYEGYTAPEEIPIEG